MWIRLVESRWDDDDAQTFRATAGTWPNVWSVRWSRAVTGSSGSPWPDRNLEKGSGAVESCPRFGDRRLTSFDGHGQRARMPVPTDRWGGDDRSPSASSRQVEAGGRLPYVSPGTARRHRLHERSRRALRRSVATRVCTPGEEPISRSLPFDQPSRLSTRRARLRSVRHANGVRTQGPGRPSLTSTLPRPAGDRSNRAIVRRAARLVLETGGRR